MARRKSRRRSRGLGSLGNVTATNAVRSFMASVQSVQRHVRGAMSATDAAGVLEHARDAKKALADAQAAAGILKSQGALHSDYRGALRQMESAVADLASREREASSDARATLGPDAYDSVFDGLGGYRRRGRRRRCRC